MAGMGGGRPRGYPGTAGGREAAGAAQAARAAAQRRVEIVGTPSEQPLVHTSTSELVVAIYNIRNSC